MGESTPNVLNTMISNPGDAMRNQLIRPMSSRSARRFQEMLFPKTLSFSTRTWNGRNRCEIDLAGYFHLTVFDCRQPVNRTK
jgi:hypothetical protein